MTKMKNERTQFCNNVLNKNEKNIKYYLTLCELISILNLRVKQRVIKLKN